ncbi:hypothetical protein [Olivibacter sitiensis]|uniref:hypothetical protein n=1 Tax=Olivibacter sitiensis TaxID=376470 RepID=UPI000484CCBB|nr:hypothetical protein [Olivibacter sitiensis]
MKRLFLVTAISLIVGTIRLQAQIIRNFNDLNPTPSVGIVLGSHGIGVEGIYSVRGDIDAKLGFNFFPISSISTGYRNNRAEIHRSNVNAFVDWRPLYDKEGFLAKKGYVSVGLSYYFSNNIDRYYDDDSEYYNLKFTDLAPYIGIGLKSLDINDKFTITTNFGFFIPLKKVEITPFNQIAEDRLYHYDMLYDQWTSAGKKFLIGLNANVGIHYRIVY